MPTLKRAGEQQQEGCTCALGSLATVDCPVMVVFFSPAAAGLGAATARASRQMSGGAGTISTRCWYDIPNSER